MKQLKDILYKVGIEAVHGATDITISKIEFDSRKIELNDVFVAIRGTLSDGHDYIEKALSLGAIAVVCEEFPSVIVNGVTYVKVKDSNEALAFLAANYYDNPSENIKLVGVTGTNGKTTIASLLYQLFKKAGYKVGLLSTVKIMVDTEEFKATHTTPDSLTLNYYLDQMIQDGCEFCFMEVSSHGVHQKRTEALRFTGGVFTNLSHDHLDYHNTFAEYRDVKKSFFDNLSKDAWILTNRIVFKIINKLNQQPRRISDVFDKIYQGIATSKDDVYFLYDCKIIEENVEGFSKYLNERVIIEKNFVKPLLKGDDVHRYEEIITNKYVIFPYDLKNDKAILYTEDKIEESFPNAYVYLKKCETALRDREKGRLKNDKFWYKYIYPKNLTLFDSEKLVAPEISLGGNFSYDQNGEFYSTTTIYGYIKSENIDETYFTLMAIMNSRLLWWFLINTGTVLANGYFRFKPNYLNPFPIPFISKENIQKIDSLVHAILFSKHKNDIENIRKNCDKIDEIIFKLYSLSDEERKIILLDN